MDPHPSWDTTLSRVAELDAERARAEARLGVAMLEHQHAVRAEARRQHTDERVRALQVEADDDELALAVRQPTRLVAERLTVMQVVAGHARRLLFTTSHAHLDSRVATTLRTTPSPRHAPG